MQNNFSQVSLGLCLLLVSQPILKLSFLSPPSPQQLYWILDSENPPAQNPQSEASWAQGYKHNKCTYTKTHTVLYSVQRHLGFSNTNQWVLAALRAPVFVSYTNRDF